jgi:hypothetical protein
MACFIIWGFFWCSRHLAAPTTTVRAIGFCQFLRSPLLVAPWNLGSACALAHFVISWSLGGLLVAGLGWSWLPSFAVATKAHPRLPPAATVVPVAVNCLELAPFTRL